MKFRWIMVFVLMIVCSSFASGALTDGLQHYFSFDNNSATVTPDYGTANLTRQSAVFQASGKINGDYSYSVNQYMSLNGDLFPEGTAGDISWGGWFQNDVANGDRYLIFQRDVATHPGSVMIRQATDDTLQVYYWYGTDNKAERYDTTLTLPEDASYHFVYFVMNQSASEAYFYVDGNNETINNASSDTSASGYSWASSSGTANSWDGDIDEFGTWNRMLTPTEIQELYNGSNGMAWPFEPSEPPPPPPTENFSISATDYLSGEVVNVFNATINGSYYNTTNGTIFTNIARSGLLINITTRSYQYFTLVNNSYNSTNNLAVVLYPYPTIRARNYYTNGSINNFTVTIDSVDYVSSNFTVVVPLNSSKDISMASVGYTTLNYTHNFVKSNGTNGTLVPLANKWVFIENSNGDPVPSTCYYDDSSDYQTSFQISTYQKSNLTMTCTADTTYRKAVQLLTDDQNNETIVREFHSLVIRFNQTVNVTIADAKGDTTITNETADIIIVQRTLSQGRIYVSFGKINDSEQFYEYINNWQTHINESMYVITNPTVPFYIKVVDESGSPLENAEITLKQINSSIGITTNLLVGKRLSRALTSSLFWLDEKRKYVIIVEKEGYDPFYGELQGNNVGSTIDSPEKIQLKQGSNPITYGARVLWAPQVFDNRTQTFYGGIQAEGIENALIITQYRSQSGGALSLSKTNITIGDTSRFDYFKSTQDASTYLDQRAFTIEPGYDYHIYGNNSIVLEVYMQKNGIWTLVRNETIEYQIEPTQNWFKFYNTLTGTWVMFVLFMVLIAISATIRYMTQSNSNGFNAFMYGLIVITVFNLNFAFVSVISGVWLVSNWLRKQTGDIS